MFVWRDSEPWRARRWFVGDREQTWDAARIAAAKDVKELKEKQKEAKVETALKMWVPGVNAEGAFGRWAFLEIDEPWNAKNTIRKFLAGRKD